MKTIRFQRVAGWFDRKSWHYRDHMSLYSMYSLRNDDPNTIQLKFLDEFDKPGLHTEYFYQIQDILDITQRKWCDLVIHPKRHKSLQISYVLAKKYVSKNRIFLLF